MSLICRVLLALTVWSGLSAVGVAQTSPDVDLVEVDLVIVAGQSNAVGFDAHPDQLPADETDQSVHFWWRCGDPPPDDHDSSSGHSWTTLRPQSLGKPVGTRRDRQYGNFAQPEGGFGPEFGLARALVGQQQRPLAVLKVAFSGTGIARDWTPDDPGDAGACYRALIDEWLLATAAAYERGWKLRPRAFCWIQGESDANAADAPMYSKRLLRMLRSVRRDLAAPGLVALVAVNTQFGNGKNQFMPEIVRQQQLAAAADPRCRYVDTRAATIANAAHFDSAGTLLVGRLLANELLAVESRLRADRRELRIVTLGDSITKGVRSGVTSEQTFASLLENKFQTGDLVVQVTNVGIGGERTDQALARLEQVLALRPDLVTIMYGTNDSYVDAGSTHSRITVAEYRSNLSRIVHELLSRGILPVLMTEPRWSDQARPNGVGENPNVRLEPFVAACREVAAEARVPLVDHYARWSELREQGRDLHELTTDGCHPNPAGHLELVQTMLPVVSKAAGPVLKFRERLLRQQPVRVVCFGDSVTGVYYHTGSRRAYTDMLGIALNRVSGADNVEMINAGISGNTTVNALVRIDQDVLAHKPDVVTVMFGLNDMVRVPLEQYAANLRTIVEKCRGAGAEVVLATPNNVITTSSRPSEKLVEYCDAVRRVALELNVPLCDCYQELAAFRELEPFAWRLLLSDPIHPNMDGHRRIAEQLARTITGVRVTLADTEPLRPGLAHTLARLKSGQPVRVLAMSPADEFIAAAIQQRFPDAQVEVVKWDVGGMSVAEIEADARQRVRPMKPDLVMIAVPRSAADGAASGEAFAGSFAWVMNWSLNFGHPTWDCVVVHPAAPQPSNQPDPFDDLIRQLVHAQDLHLMDRRTGDDTKFETILFMSIAELMKSQPGK